MYLLSKRNFLAINLLSIVALFAVILAGGIVRSSGSGMGCPDWPKCFDQYIPPTNVSQLPVGYQSKYVAKRVAKNQRLAKTLDFLGYKDLADQVRHDPSIAQPEEFNAFKTWTEYANRLVGAICGLFMLACLICSLSYWSNARRLFVLSLINVLLVGFQAWLGSLVVSTNLLAWMVTVHMLVAFIILAISIYTYYYVKHINEVVNVAKASSAFLYGLSIFVLVLILIQVILGTEVREKIDFVANASGILNRSEWVSQVGYQFHWHRDMSILVLISTIISFSLICKSYRSNEHAFNYGVYSLLLVFLQILVGVVLSYFSLPPLAQAMHILLASLLFGTQFYLILILGRNNMYT